MTHTNESLLREMRVGGLCDYCGCRVPLREPHHVFSRGTGRLDLRINLAALCPPFFGQSCHVRFHAGEIGRGRMIVKVAHRERTRARFIRDVVDLLRRLDRKNGYQWTMKGRPIAEELADLGPARGLAELTLREMGIHLEAA